MLDHLRARQRVSTLPVVIISAHAVAPSEMRGARRVIQKPMTLLALMHVVAQFCGPGWQ